jgi:hypothetical protein
MTNSELINLLQTSQAMLSDVYHYAIEIGDGAMEEQMSCADSCISEALDLISMSENDDGQPDEAQEWHDFDPDC